MNNNLMKILEDIDKNLKVNYNEIFLRRDLTELEILAIIIHCNKNNIDEISETLDINYEKINIDYLTDSEIIDFFDYMLYENDYEDDFLNKYTKIVLEEAIKNTRINFSFLDIRQIGLINMFKFKDEYYEKLSKKYSEFDMEYIFRKFIKRSMLLHQKIELDNIKESEFASLLYIKIKSEISSGKDLENILTSLGITKEYYESLSQIYNNIKITMEYDEIIENMNIIKEKYDIAIKTSRLNYIEENEIIKYLENNIKNNIVKMAIFKLSIRLDISYMNEIYKMTKELEIIDEKLN